MPNFKEHLPYALTQFETEIIVPIKLFGIDVSLTTLSSAKLTTAALVGAYLVYAMRDRAIVPDRLQASAEMLYSFGSDTAWLNGVARNPGASENLQQVSYLAFALTEAIGLFALIVAFIILFVG